MALLLCLLPSLVSSQSKFLSPSGGALPIGKLYDISWSTDCPGGCSSTSGSIGKCSINLVCSPNEYEDFSLNVTEWQIQASNWPRVTLLDEKPIPSDLLSSRSHSSSRMTHSIETVLGLQADVVPSSVCALEMIIEGPTRNSTTEAFFWAGFRILNPSGNDVSWPSGRSYQVRWQPAASRNWAEITLLKGGTEVISLHPTEDSIGSPSLSGQPWCINSGSCWVFIPDVESQVSYDGISDTDYQFRIRQFFYEGSYTATQQAAYLRNNSLESFSDQFQVGFNINTFYKDTSVVVYGILLTLLVIGGFVGVGYVRHKQRRILLDQVHAIALKLTNAHTWPAQQDIYIKLLSTIIEKYFTYLLEELETFSKKNKCWNFYCFVTVAPLLKTTFDLCYDVYQYTLHHPHPIFIVDIVLQIVAHLAKLRYDHVRLEEMKNIGAKGDSLTNHIVRLVSIFANLLSGKSVASRSNISSQGILRVIWITCEQINGVVGIFIAAHLNLNWSDWGTQSALLQIKLILQVLSFNWSFFMLIRGLVGPMKQKMLLVKTADQISRFGFFFVVQRNLLLGVLYAGIWHNPTLDIFGTNATLTLVVIFLLVSPVADMFYFISSLVDYVFEDVQYICVHSGGVACDYLDYMALSRNTDQKRINNKIKFFTLSVLSQVIFLIILNVTNTFSYTTEAYYVRVGATIYVCLSNSSKVLHLSLSFLFCRCCGWGSKNVEKNVVHWHHACCCFWTAGLWAPCWLGASYRCCCLTPCACDEQESVGRDYEERVEMQS